MSDDEKPESDRHKLLGAFQLLLVVISFGLVVFAIMVLTLGF